jgi:Rhodopirellula transposase DDE domain
MAQIERLLEHDTAGDPISGLKWTRKTTAKIAVQLGRLGIQVSARTVARLLRKLHFSLRVNQKKIGTRCGPARDQQFTYLHKLREHFRRQGNPILSVDAKKRELVGNFKNAGAKWDREATAVNDHDFRSLAVGVAILYGLYDPQANRGSVCVGVSHETSAFAVASIRQWWHREGHQRYPKATQLLLLADTGGSNSATRGAWKDQLQQQLCDQCGLTITVAHYPTGTSKYNPIERRLFSAISKNWAGEPLGSYEKILKFIRTTRTSTGLKVRAYLDRKVYPLGITPSAQRLRQLRITRHKVIPKWNYTVTPSNVKYVK